MGKIETSNYLRSNNRIRLEESVPLPSPLILLVEPTNLCNLKCAFCPTSDEELLKRVGRPKGTMPLELFKKVVDDCKAFIHADGTPGINGFYPHKDGEPLLHKDIAEMIAYAKKANIAKEIRLITNGFYLTPEMNQKLIDAGLDWIRVSVNGVSDEKYAELCRTNVSVDQLVNNVADLFSRRENGTPFMIAKMIDVNRTEEEKRLFYEKFQTICDVCSLEEVGGWSTTGDRDFALGIKNNSCNGIQRKERFVCPMPFYSLSINFDGKVGICCYDWAHQTIVGDVTRESLLDIWNGEKMYEFRMYHLNHERNRIPACAKCRSISIQPDNIDGYEERMIAALSGQKKGKSNI